MAAALTELSGLVGKTPGVAGGQPCIAGTGVTVYWVGYLATREGLSAEEIRRDVIGEHLSLAQVYAALAYFHLNREALEAEADRLDGIADEQAAALPPLAPVPVAARATSSLFGPSSGSQEGGNLCPS